MGADIILFLARSLANSDKSDDDDDEDYFEQGGGGKRPDNVDYDAYGNPKTNMTCFNHIAQALRLIASRSRHGPTLLVIDDIQLLFRERMPLHQLYDGIPDVFAWFMKCEAEGVLDVVFCSSEKSAVSALKRCK
jgi:hypothetical protein